MKRIAWVWATVGVLCVAAPSVAGADDAPAYKLKLDVDVPALVIAALSTTAWFVGLAPAECAPLCDKSTVNSFDRPFAGRYSPAWTTTGTITASVILVTPPILMLAIERPRYALNDTVVLSEAVLASNALSVIFNVGARRPRPFMYSDAAPVADRLDSNGSFSFFSGHTCASFAASIATWRTLDRLHVAPRWKWLALGVGLAGSSFVAVSRVISGDHFPSDVIVGAGVGTSFGFLVPALHDRGVAVTPSYSADSWSMTVAGRF